MSTSTAGSGDIGITSEEMLAVRRRLQAQFAAIPLAWSIDGKTFGYEAPLDFPIPSGSYVRIVSPANETYLGQVVSRSIATREGPELAIDAGQRIDLAIEGASVSQTTVRLTIRYLEGEGILLGRLTEGTLSASDSSGVFQNAEMVPAPIELLNLYLNASGGSSPLAIGHATYGDSTSIAALRANGFDRHTFLCGQSGSGKTYSLGLVLEQLLLRTDLRLLVIDPNSDYVRLPELRDNAGSILSAEELEHFLSVSQQIRVLRPTDESGGNRLAIRFGDLTRNEQAMVLQLDPLADREEYSGFWRIVDHIGHEEVELGDVLNAAMRDSSVESRQVSLRVRNLGVTDWSLWCKRGETSFIDLLDEDSRAIVLDVGTFGLPEEKEVATLALLSQLWRQREQRRPQLIVVDEAHNICPAEPKSALQVALTQYIIRFAGEGRKYGLYLLLSSQRPQKIHPNVLSQCDNLIAMRMNSSADLALLAEVFSFVPGDLLAEASLFRQGESLIAGRIVQNPTFIRFGSRVTEEGGLDVPTTWARSVQPGS
jgi:uncharacterized protein